jgi:hypothetical protein
MLTLVALEYRGPFFDEFWAEIGEEYMKKVGNSVKVFGKGTTPFSATLRACTQARQVCGVGVNYVNLVNECLDLMKVKCNKPFQMPEHGTSQRCYAILTLVNDTIEKY